MFRLLKTNEIECKISNTKNITTNGIQLLLYKTARTDMDVLDETVGPMMWECEYKEIKGNMYCGISIFNGNTKITKWDCGVESAFGDKEKGEASDSFKRAGAKWGIGRELYTSPYIWINLKDYKLSKDNKTTYDNFQVDFISYDENRRINGLKIKNTTLNRIVFDMKSPISKETEQPKDTLVSELEAKSLHGILLKTNTEEKIIETLQKGYKVNSTAELKKSQYAEILRKLNKGDK